MKIPKSRWEEAQDFELHDWKEQKDIVKKEWDEAYRKYNTYFTELENNLKVTEKWNILDVGCNLTCISRMIKKGNHIGVEPLADALKIQDAVPNVKIYQGMGENMPFDKEYFDLIICRNVIDHTHDPQKVILEIQRVLKPGGYFLLACYIYNPFISFVKNFGEGIKVLRNVGHPHTYTMKSLEGLIQNNFSVIDRKIIYEGISPNDFGKIDEVQDNLPLVQKLVMFVNDKILRNKWFVREYTLLGRKL